MITTQRGQLNEIATLFAGWMEFATPLLGIIKTSDYFLRCNLDSESMIPPSRVCFGYCLTFSPQWTRNRSRCWLCSMWVPLSTRSITVDHNFQNIPNLNLHISHISTFSSIEVDGPRATVCSTDININMISLSCTILEITIIIIIRFGDTVTVTHPTKCNTNSKVRAMSA